MNTLQLDLADKKQVRDFLGLPFRIYRTLQRNVRVFWLYLAVSCSS
ncbi:MAG: hypothetical protein ABIL11_17815 [Chloroflexota bacterium]